MALAGGEELSARESERGPAVVTNPDAPVAESPAA